jgi:predicted transcriptional regulator
MSESTDDVQLSDWQIEEVKKGLAEADAGDFATDEEMARVVEKWTKERKADS